MFCPCTSVHWPIAIPSLFTGKKWADDAPSSAVDAESVSLMSFGSCGAFIHGLEDEFFAVRSEAVKSLTKLAIRNPKMAVLALGTIAEELSRVNAAGPDPSSMHEDDNLIILAHESKPLRINILPIR